jgi:hypothetical protein
MDDVRLLDRSVLAAEAFLVELSELSRKHGVGINGNGEIFEMDFPTDWNLQYGMDADRRLSFV